MRVALVLALAVPLAAQPLLHLPPSRVWVEIEHQRVEIAASGTVSAGMRPDTYALAISADLSDLQAHITEILHAALDRSEECGERIAVRRGALVPAAPGALLTAELHVERWVCGKALGRSVKKRLVAGDGTMRVALTPVVESAAKARVDAEVRDIQADGTLGELLRSGSLGAAVREKIRASVQAALDKATDVHATLPAAIQDLVRIRGLSFADTGGGRLGLSVDAEAALSGAQLEQLRGAAGRQR